MKNLIRNALILIEAIGIAAILCLLSGNGRGFLLLAQIYCSIMMFGAILGILMLTLKCEDDDDYENENRWI